MRRPRGLAVGLLGATVARLFAVTSEERRQLERDLHDGVIANGRRFAPEVETAAIDAHAGEGTRLTAELPCAS